MSIAIWNVRTLYRAGAMNGLVKEMDEYKVDTCALQEIRRPGKGTAIKKNYVILYSGYREAITSWTEYQHFRTWKAMPGCRHGKLFIGRPYKKRTDDLLKLGRHQLKIAVAILTGHAAVRGHLRIMGLFNGNPSCRFCRMENETVQHITCCCEALALQRYIIFGKPFVEPKDIRTASLRDLCLFIRDRGILSLC
jgi:hypothetical protein